MSLETHSTKRERVYRRAFDHEEAKQLHKAGASYLEIATHFGVSDAAVRRVCDPATQARMGEATNEWMRRHRMPCKRCGERLVWPTSRTGVCASCRYELKAAPNVRPDELRCTKCGEWKPDEEFLAEKRATRRGRRSWCRACETASRRKNRRANPQREREYQRQKKRENKPMTEWIVVREGENGTWESAGTVEANSRLHAVEKVADREGRYAAISASQVHEVAEQTRYAVVGDARRGPG